jgi:hypothetical protein
MDVIVVERDMIGVDHTIDMTICKGWNDVWTAKNMPFVAVFNRGN